MNVHYENGFVSLTNPQLIFTNDKMNAENGKSAIQKLDEAIKADPANPHFKTIVSCFFPVVTVE